MLAVPRTAHKQGTRCFDPFHVTTIPAGTKIRLDDEREVTTTEARTQGPLNIDTRDRGARLRLWLPPDVFDRVERAARAGGVSVGEWVRGVIVAALGR